MNHRKEIEEQQLQILERIHDCQEPVAVPELTGILKNLSGFSAPAACYAFGDEFGQKLWDFSQAIDTDNPHPDLFHVFGGALVGGFSHVLCDVLMLAGPYCMRPLYHDVLKSLQNLVAKQPDYKDVSQNIDDPRKNLQHVRFLSDPAHRRQCRMEKDVQIVGLGVLYRKGETFWDDHSDDFSLYHRGINRFGKERDEAVNRIAHFQNMGLQEMSQEIQKFIDEQDEMLKKEQHFGFNRISLTTASIILAKMSGFGFMVEHRPYGSSGVETMCYKTTEGSWWFDDKWNSSISYRSSYGKVEIRPRTYPYEKFEDQASEEIKRAVSFLDAFPEAGGKPLFDHYRVLVPGLNYPNTFQRQPFHYKTMEGHQIFFSDIEAGQISLDMDLCQSGDIVGALLGEKDGEHYFISYWM